MPRAKKPTTTPAEGDDQLIQDEAGNQVQWRIGSGPTTYHVPEIVSPPATPYSDLPIGDPMKTCNRCDGHQESEHDQNPSVEPDSRLCLVDIPITMGDGTTGYVRCGCPGFRSVWVQEILNRGPENWSDDPDHAAFAASFGLRFCECGKPGTAHFRGGAVPPAFEGDDICEGFRLDAGGDPEKVNVWPPETWEGRQVLSHAIGFGGRLELAVDNPDHVQLWHSLTIGERFLLEVEVEVVGTGEHVPIKAKGTTIGLAAVTKLRIRDVRALEAAAIDDEAEEPD